MLMSECVLIYLEKESVPQLQKLCINYFSKLIWIDYEMFNPYDGFGKVMIKNFKSKGVPLASIDCFKSLEQIKKGYTDLDYSCELKSMFEIIYKNIDPSELQRISKLEWIDEFEEFNLMNSHYFISVAKFSDAKSDQIDKISLESLKTKFKQFQYYNYQLNQQCQHQI